MLHCKYSHALPETPSEYQPNTAHLDYLTEHTHVSLCVYSNDFLKTFASRSEKFLQKVAVNLML